MTTCSNCRKNFFTHVEDTALYCSFCGNQGTVYDTYSFIAVPTFDEEPETEMCKHENTTSDEVYGETFCDDCGCFID